jgi:ribosomal protein S18 acetylase RimI-like enzyme
LYRENISPLQEYKIGFVALIASSKEFKEKKFASNLLNYVLDKEKRKGTQFVVANTETKNESAIAFFKSNGFKITAHLNEYHIWN